MAVRIAIAEDQRLIRELLAQVLAREGDFEVVAQAAGGREAIALARSAAPDVLVLDLGLPDMSGVEVARALRIAQPKLAIVTLSMHEEPYLVQ